MTSDNLILEKWFTRNGLAEGTRKIYKISISEYRDFVGKSLSDLIDEAENEQEKSIKPMKRAVNEYLFSFKDFLDKKGYAPGSVNHKIAAIKSFYKAYDIHIINLKTHQGDTVLEKNRGKLLTKKDIQMMLDVSNARDRAMIYLMALTGMAQNEVRHLTIRQFIKYAGQAINRDINTIEDIFEHEDEILEEILIFEIVRKKVNYRHHVLLPPEVTRPIIAYLKERYHNRNKNRHIRTLDDPIFVTNKGSMMTRTGIGSEIKRIGKLVGFKSEQEGSYSYWRPHAFRKYFISTIIRATGDKLLADYLVGHKIDDTLRSYWIIQPEELKEKYLSVYEELSLDNVKVKTLYTDQDIENKILKRDKTINKLQKEMQIIQNIFNDPEFIKDYVEIEVNLN